MKGKIAIFLLTSKNLFLLLLDKGVQFKLGIHPRKLTTPKKDHFKGKGSSSNHYFFTGRVSFQREYVYEEKTEQALTLFIPASLQPIHQTQPKKPYKVGPYQL